MLQTALLPQDYFPISCEGTEAFGALGLGDNLISCLALTVGYIVTPLDTKSFSEVKGGLN